MAAEEDDLNGTNREEASQQGRSAGGQGTGPSSDPSNVAVTVHLAQARHVSQTRFPTKPDTPRSSEPILIPKLRIQFADFPYLH
ncbi:hypothetical protein M0802_016222 [Mischocyttarus mexicanus]|nr:hypothetical protein M0802_016222 [Mischocyttarus mexicanus]